MITIKDFIIDKYPEENSFKFQETPNHSGLFGDGMPDTIVLHYTAGASCSSSANWLCNPQAKASAHVVIGRKGEIVQLLPFNKQAWHAGRSEWKGRRGLNKYSIGIEMANSGILTKRLDGYYTAYGHKIPDDNVVIAKHKNREQEYAWECYTPMQIETVQQLCIALCESYDIKEIVGHEDIAPKRKTDPGPAFPMEMLRNKVLFGRHEQIDTEIESSGIVKGIVTADLLNIREYGDVRAQTVAEPLRQGSRVEILESKHEWKKVRFEVEGWVSANYVKTFE